MDAFEITPPQPPREFVLKLSEEELQHIVNVLGEHTSEHQWQLELFSALEDMLYCMGAL